MTIELMRELQCEPINLLVICDILRDNDDELALVLASHLHRHGFLKLLGVVTNYIQPVTRARAAKGALKTLGLGSVPVAAGTDCRCSGKMLDYESQVPYLADESELFRSTNPKESDGLNLLRRTLENAEEYSVTLLLISGLTDAAELIRRYPDLVVSRVKRVVIMGGLNHENGEVQWSEFHTVTPDTAANNEFDWFAAYYAHARLMELGVPMTILSKDAAYAAQIPFGVYNDAKDTDHPIGARLAAAQGASLEGLWKRTWLPMNDPNRQLPERCSPEWFRNTFLDGRGEDRAAEDPIWDLAAKFQLYDPMTLVACFPELVEEFFQPVWFANDVSLDDDHCLIGPTTEDGSPVRRPDALVAFLCEGIARAMAEAMQG